MKNNIFTSILLISLMLAAGCFPASRAVKNIDGLYEAQEKQQAIRVLARDSKIYTLDHFSITHNSLSGKGFVEYDNEEAPFVGEVPYSEIEFIERLKPEVWKGFWIIPASLGIIGGIVSLAEPQKFTIERVNTSCPFIYAYDGKQYHLEAEAFSTSISKALEAETFHHLRSLNPVQNKLKVRVANKRPETHVFNSIHLFSVDAGDASSIVLDTENKVWPVYNETFPFSVTDHSGNEVSYALSASDRHFWSTDYASANPDSEFRDELNLKFNFPDEKSTATLIVDAINSDLITEVYSAAGAIIGEQTLQFYHTLENEPALQDFFLNWIDKSSLRVEVLSRNGWQQAGIIRPEANEVAFRRAVRLDNLTEAVRPLTIRLSSLSDVWRIDAVSIDDSAGGPLTMHPAELVSLTPSGSVGQGGSAIQQAVEHIDTTYSVLLPPEYLDLAFDATEASHMQNPQFIFAASGYLYEWFPQTDNPVNATLTEWFNNIAPMNKLSLFNRYEDRFLSAIYAGRKKND